MGTNREILPGLPAGEQPVVEKWPVAPVVADTFAGRIHVEWDGSATVTPLGQLPFFIEYLKQGGVFDGWVAGCPMHFRTHQVNATFLARCFCLCWPATDAMRTSRRCDVIRSIRHCWGCRRS